MILLILMNLLQILFSLMCDPANKPFILPVQDPLLKFEQQYSNTESIGFGLWLKWQPQSLIKQISNNPSMLVIQNTNANCQNQFIYKVHFTENLQNSTILQMSMEKKEVAYQLTIESDFFTLDQNYMLFGNIEGNWIFVQSYFDFSLKKTAFIYFSSSTQQFYKIDTDYFPNFNNKLYYSIGGTCQNCIIQGKLRCLSQFKGRITSVTYGNEKITKDNIDAFKESCFSVIQDCKQNVLSTLIEDFYIQKNEFKLFETQVMEIQIFKMTGWIKLTNSDLKNTEITIFRITSNINEQLKNYNEALIFKYIFQQRTDISLTSLYSSRTFFIDDTIIIIFQNWHYFEFSVVNNELASLKIISHRLNLNVELSVYVRLSTGVQNFIFFGGDYFSTDYFQGNVYNLQYQNFCDPSQISNKFHCHYTCSSCDGPLNVNCLSCSDENNRQLYNNECKCKLSTVDYFNKQKCYSIKETFGMFSEIEEEIKCEIEGENFCRVNNNILCSFGYFLYENQCIKCPHLDQQKLSSFVFCLECILNPKDFRQNLYCATDAISYNLNEVNIYEQIKKQKDEIEYYEIIQVEKDQYELKLRVYKQLIDHTLICKVGFYMKDNKCLSCGEFCEKCDIQEICQKCKEGYYLNDHFGCEKCKICDKCVIDKGNILCQQCPEKFYLNQDFQCLPCGQNCASCRNNRFCNYCDDPQTYYISLDGINCNVCEIKNCKYCFQMLQQSFEIITSLDLNLENTWLAYQKKEGKTYCLKCQEDYILDYVNNICFLNIKINYPCQYGKYSFGEFYCTVFEKCDYFNNCRACDQERCYQCFNGYYLDFFLNKCISCPSQCYTCFKQSIQQKDYWKEEIQPFYNFLMEMQTISHNFYDNIKPKHRDDYEIVCFSCYEGFILQNFQCLQKCQKGCAQCEIKNNKRICLKCDDIENRIARSVNKEGFCWQCSSNCVACAERDEDEIYALNKYFNKNSDNAQYTRKCYSLQKNSQSLNLYSNQNIIIECQQYNRCMKRVTFEWNLYCEIEDFKKIDKNEKKLLGQNFYLDDFLSNGISFKIEYPELANYFNSQSIQYIDINLNFISGFSNNCDCQNGRILQTKFMETIFWLQQVNIKFIGKNLITKLSNFNLVISGFSQIRFENVKFLSSIISINEDKIKQVSFINCEVLESTVHSVSRFYFTSSEYFNLNLFNFNITKIKYTARIMFQIISQNNQDSIKINITNLNLMDSQLSDAKLIFLNIWKQNNNINLYMKNIKILDSIFQNSYFISSVGDQLSFLDLVNIDNLYIYKTNLSQSMIFHFPNMKILNLQQMTFKESNLTQNSFLILSNQFSCFDIQLQDLEIKNSYIFSNVIDQQFQLNFQENIIFSLSQIYLNNISYDNFQFILHIIQYEHYLIDLEIKNLKLTQLKYIGNMLAQKMNYITNEYAIIHLNCQICILINIEIIRENGAPEISIINSQKIFLQNLRFTQKQQNDIWKYIHPSFHCLRDVYLLQKFFFLYIGRYQDIVLESIVIENAVTVNYPFIQIQGYGLNEKRTDETILIKNSIFRNNIMIISLGEFTTSCLSISSEQQSNIILQNNTFIYNHLNSHDENQISILSSTIMIDTKIGLVLISNSLFRENLITNSKSSNMHLNVASLVIQSTIFLQNNLINYTKLINNILFEEDTFSVRLQDLKLNFQILSEGGSGYIKASQINFNDISVIESYAIRGGAFYIILHSSSMLFISNSLFQKNFATLLSSMSSQGGSLFINAENSGFFAKMKNITFNNTFSRERGGGVYIIPSNTQNKILFSQIKVYNCFSIIGAFFDFSLRTFQGVQSSLTFESFYIYQQKVKYEEYVKRLENLQNSEANSLLNFNTIFQVSYTNITFSKFKFQSELGTYLANLEKCQFIQFLEINVIDSVLLKSPLLKINFIPNYSGKCLINNFQIKNLTEHYPNEISKQCINIFFNSSINFYCQNLIKSQASIKMIDNSEEILENQNICNNQLLKNIKSLNFSLIQITDIEQQHFIQFQNITLNKIICNNCQYGLINFLNIQKTNENNIKLNQIILLNCSCGYLSCLSIIQHESLINVHQISTEGNRILSQQNFLKIQQSNILQVVIQDCQFTSNRASYGGALFISDIDMMIVQSQFLQNIAEYGGAIYFQKSSAKLLIIESLIIENQAKIAGGIFLEDSILQETQNLNVIIKDNYAAISGKDFKENPRSLVISTDNGKTYLQKKTTLFSKRTMIEQIVVKPYKLLGYKEKAQFLTFPSGIKINSYSYYDIYTSTKITYNLTFRIIALNKFRQVETLLEGKQCFLSHKVINSTNQQEVQNYYAQISISQVSFDNETRDFNLDSLIIQFNPYYEKEIVLRIYIKCDFIQIPIYDKAPPYLIDDLITDYQIFLDVKTFPCQLGEYFNSTSGICIQCDSSQSQYQVEQNATICLFKDETKIEQVESQMIQLKPSFWRAYFYSSKIEECFHLFDNCLGGWKPGDDSCSLGHIGALCEQCDLYNIRGNGHFSTSQPYKCGNCEQISGNIISITLISIWTLISVLMSVNSTIQTIKQYLAGSKLVIFGVKCLNKESSVAVLIKVFTNYLQIIQTISTFKLEVPTGLSSGIKSVGNPIEQMAYSLDCFLIQISDITIIYFRIIWSLCMAFSYIFIFFIILAGGILSKKVQFNLSMVTTALIYIFIFLQPNIILALISLVSYRVISDVTWVSGNVSYRYDTNSHKIWILMFCIPLLFSFSLLIPFIMYFGVRRNKNKLDLIKTREAWGFLYNEYKLHAYFWEFIKIFQKEFIIIILSFYEEHIAIKASLVFLFIFAYSFLSGKIRPYMTGELNNLDMQSTTICAISIILGSSIYTAQNSNLLEIIYPFYIIIALLNGYFLLQIIMKIVFGYYNQMYEQIDKIKQIISSKFNDQLQTYPKLIKFLECKKEKDDRIQKHYKILKIYLIKEAKRILELKNKNVSEKYIIISKKIKLNKTENNILSQEQPKSYPNQQDEK